jgi:protein-S-isoprenylcysteine O-methyltransferase Ste14
MRWRTLALVVALLVTTLYEAFIVVNHGVWKPHHTVGLLLLVPSFCLWALARRQLGAAFAVRAEARQLVTTGLYARIRNPVYLFGWIFNAGLFTFTGLPVLFPLLVVLAVMQVVRSRREQRVLEAAFGETYRAYKQQTWF